MSLKAIFDIDGDQISATVPSTDGPKWLLVVSALAMLAAVVLAVLGLAGFMDPTLGWIAALSCGTLCVLALVLNGALWPQFALRIDRESSTARLERRGERGDAIPMRKIRFEIRDHKGGFGLADGHVLVARIPEGPELQVLLSVDRQRVQMLYQEIGEWLARKRHQDTQEDGKRTEPQPLI